MSRQASASALPTGNPVSIKIALSDAGWARLTPVKGYEKQENEHPGETKAASDSAIPVNPPIKTLALNRSRDNLCKFERVGEVWQAATGGCIAASPPFAFWRCAYAMSSSGYRYLMTYLGEGVYEHFVHHFS
jgi:hypothetical protein